MNTHPEKEKLLAELEQNLRRAEAGIDVKLAESALRDKHPECEAALVASLEQSRQPLRAAFIQKADEVLDAYWKKLQEWETEYVTFTEELRTLIDEYGTAFSQRLAEMVAEFKALDAQSGLTTQELEERNDAILRAAEESRESATQKVNAQYLDLKNRMSIKMKVRSKIDEEMTAALAALPQQYVLDCETKAKPIYEEFLVPPIES